MLLNVGLAIFVFIFPLSPKISISLFNTAMDIRIDDVIVPLLLMLWCIELLRKKRKFVYSRLYIPIGAYFLIHIVSMLTGYYLKHTVVDPVYASCVIWRSAEYYIIFFLTVNIIKTKKQILQYLNIWLIAAVCVALYGIVDQVLNISGIQGLYDAGWFHAQSNHIGGYLMVSLIIALGLTVVTESKSKKIALSAAIILLLYILIFNFSRTTYLSVIAAIFVYCASRSRKLIILPIVLTVMLFWLVPRIAPQALISKYLHSVIRDSFSTTIYSEIKDDPAASDFSAGRHRFLVKRALGIFRQHPILGEGSGARSLDYYDSQIAIVPATTGVIGSLAFVWLLFFIFRRGILIFCGTQDRFIREIARAFLAVFVGVAVHSIASVAYFIAVIAYSFWLLTGIIFSFPVACQKN